LLDDDVWDEAQIADEMTYYLYTKYTQKAANKMTIAGESD
jgi:hypothetical protein